MTKNARELAIQHLQDTGLNAKDAKRLGPALAQRWQEDIDNGSRHPNNPLPEDSKLSWLD